MTDTLQRGSGRGLGKMVLRSSAWLVGARIGRILTTLAGTALLSRLLSPADFGLFFFAITAMALVVIVLEGFIDFPITRADVLTDEGVRSVVWASLMLVAVFSAAVWFASPTIERLLGFTMLSDTLRSMTPAFFAQIPLMLGPAVLKRQHRFAPIAIGQVLNVAIYVGIACALVTMGSGFASLIVAINLAQVLTAAFLAFAAGLPLMPPKAIRFPGGLVAAATGAVSRFIAWFWTNLDTLAVSVYFNAAMTGLYSRAYNLNVQAKEPFAAIDQPIRQAFATMKDREGGFTLQAVLALRLITLVTGLAAAGMIIFRDAIVYILLGSQWGVAALPFAILAAGLPARVALLYMDSVTIASGAMKALLLRNLVVTVVLGGGLLLCAHRGIGWIAAAVTIVVYLSLMLTDSARKAPGALPRTKLIQAMGPGLVACAVVASIGAIVDQQAIAPAWAYIIKAATIGLIAMAIAIGSPERWLGPLLGGHRRKLLGRLAH